MTGGYLRRSTSDRVIAGVCGGLAEHFGLNATVIRVAFILCSGLPLYVLLWIIIPQEE